MSGTGTGEVDAILPLDLVDLSYEVRGQRLLDGISVRLEAGPLTVILGPNGAGKSLTLRLAHGLLQPTAGTVRWCGSAAIDARRRQTMVFERPVLLRRSTAANIGYALHVRGVPRVQRHARIAKALADTGLAALATRRARVLSAGEQQRVALARAWVLEPEVLFLDEPTRALDPSATRQVEELIRAIARSGAKIVMTTHDLGQAQRLADEVLFLHRGALLEHAPAKRFFEKPESDEARAFLRGELFW